ncbi:O-antigen ligase family protein [Candidatus Phycosocius spiralis]|uniref:O-antigen ligase-related domain-containing protein n=1 Tax=Candidatus Phycosocius spiralis TaxID=2815099 RepID=A0ABQ4PX77_9PROT|nr:O-antigen ligase family protein [Candidatus Phycosocius spiralis]GIU67694.1 hypothetical protein PsB1_1848 [Candidatus Phycosocius spiralis]
MSEVSFELTQIPPQAGPLDPRTKIAGAFGIGFGFFAGTGVSGLAMGLCIIGIWGLIYGLSSPDRSLAKALVATLKARTALWLVFGLFVLWVMLSALWSPAKILAGETVRRLAVLTVLAPPAIWVVHSCLGSDRGIAQRGIIAGIFFSFILLTFDANNHYAMNQIASPGKLLWSIYGDMGRAASATLALSWVGYACLHQQFAPRSARILFIVLALYLSTQFTINLNALGLFFGTLAALFALRFPKSAIGLVSGVSAVVIAAAPLIYPLIAKMAFTLFPGNQMPTSYGRRAQMWEAAGQLIAQKPLTGWGLGASSLFDRPVPYNGSSWPMLQLHPHSAPLHIWLETGGIGAFLATMMVLLAGGVAMSVFGRHRIATAALVGGLTFLALTWGISHAAWREWVWTSFAALLAFSFTLRTPDYEGLP